jgi:hypothetical protein
MRGVGIETSSQGRTCTEGLAVSTIKQIDLHSTGAAAGERRLRATSASRALPLEQGTLRRASESPVDHDRKVIPFRANAATTRTLGLQSGDTNFVSRVIQFRPRQHAPRNWHAAANAPAANAEKSFEGKFGNHQAAAQADDDHSHRMVVNLLAAAVSLMLIIAGDWMVNALVKMP